VNERESLIPDVPVVFGLRAQGHIPTVRAMLRAGRSWEEIGREIGWDGDTARRDWRADQDAVGTLADRVLDGVIVALQDFTTEELHAVADHREQIYAECWMPRLIREYVGMHRRG
jgi:hypothetical protein